MGRLLQFLQCKKAFFADIWRESFNMIAFNIFSIRYHRTTIVHIILICELLTLFPLKNGLLIPVRKPGRKLLGEIRMGRGIFLFSSARNKAPDTTIKDRLNLNV
jgi:hypothetical protein